MKQYLDLLKEVRNHGIDRGDRTGTGTRSIFGYQSKYDLSKGFPIVTVKFTPFRLIVTELLWMISGDTNIDYLTKHNNHIWDEWADDDGELGPIYGKMWRAFPSEHGPIDQLKEVIHLIKNEPNSRRMIISAWHPGLLPDSKVPPRDNPVQGLQALPPCHHNIQFSVVDSKLNCMFTMRSNDLFLGAPFNIAQYALLTSMIAHTCGLQAGTLVHSVGDAHIYHNHFEQVDEVLTREPLKLPTIWINPRITDIFKLVPDDIHIIDYSHHSALPAKVAV